MTSRAVTRAYNAFLREAGLPVTQFSLLSTIKLGSYVSLSDVANSLALERTTLLRNLGQLEAANLVAPVERGPAGSARGKRYRLTPEGEAALDTARPLWLKAQKAFTDASGSDDAIEIGRTLTRLRRTAEALAPNDRSPVCGSPPNAERINVMNAPTSAPEAVHFGLVPMHELGGMDGLAFFRGHDGRRNACSAFQPNGRYQDAERRTRRGGLRRHPLGGLLQSAWHRSWRLDRNDPRYGDGLRSAFHAQGRAGLHKRRDQGELRPTDLGRLPDPCGQRGKSSMSAAGSARAKAVWSIPRDACLPTARRPAWCLTLQGCRPNAASTIGVCDRPDQKLWLVEVPPFR